MHKSSVDFDRTFAALPGNNWYDQGEALANAGHYIEALASFDNFLAVQPNYRKAWTFRGVVLIHLGRYQEALDSCNRALEIRRDSEAWTFRGVALYRLGRYREAYASYDKALGIYRRSVWHRLTQRLKRAKGLLVFQALV